MAKENEEPEDKPKLVQKKNPSPMQKQRCQQAFEKGMQNVKQRNFDYATEMFSQCVELDPDNLEYIGAFIDNLQKKYKNNKKGNNPFGLKGMGARGTIKKAITKSDWGTAIKAGLELLEINPWDIPTLLQIAKASAGLGCYNAQLYYLKLARDTHTDPGDVEINRACSDALENIGQFDQAMACWENVKKHHPNDEEAQSAIAALHANKMEFMKGTKDGIRSGAKKGAESSAASREEELLQTLEADPADVGTASELAELYARDDRYNDAKAALKKSLEATGGDVKVREQLEDVQLKQVRHQAMQAEKKAEQEPTDENKDNARQMAIEQIKVEMGVFGRRSERALPSEQHDLEIRIRPATPPGWQAPRSDQRVSGRRKAATPSGRQRCFSNWASVSSRSNNGSWRSTITSWHRRIWGTAI